MTTAFRKISPVLLEPIYRNQGILTTCETVDAELVQQLLDQPGCVGMRIYSGMDEKNLIHSIIVGVNAEDQDILPTTAQALAGDEGLIIDNTVRCPYSCPPPSVLNP
jgi:hypothetical protein